jgi:hypothetical protein
LRQPRSLDEITAAWLSDALSGPYLGTRVLRAALGTEIRGMATKAQYHLTYDTSRGAPAGPASLWVKGGFEAHSGAQPKALVNEVNFFRDLRPRLDIRCPVSYFQVIDLETGNGIVLLEDLETRQARFGQAAVSLSAADAAKVLDLQARYHASFWQSAELDEFAWLSSGGSIADDGVIDIFLGLWDVSETLPRFAAVSPDLRHRRRIRTALYRMFELARDMPVCLVHGDTHAGNLYFEPDGLPGYLDWQQVMKGPWAHDVAGFLITALDPPVRRSHERALLTHYLERLRAYGAAAPTADDAWNAYRRHAMWTFMWTLCPTAFHPEETCTAVAPRPGPAHQDHRRPELLVA